MGKTRKTISLAQESETISDMEGSVQTPLKAGRSGGIGTGIEEKSCGGNANPKKRRRLSMGGSKNLKSA